LIEWLLSSSDCCSSLFIESERRYRHHHLALALIGLCLCQLHPSLIDGRLSDRRLLLEESPGRRGSQGCEGARRWTCSMRYPWWPSQTLRNSFWMVLCIFQVGHYSIHSGEAHSSPPSSLTFSLQPWARTWSLNYLAIASARRVLSLALGHLPDPEVIMMFATTMTAVAAPSCLAVWFALFSSCRRFWCLSSSTPFLSAASSCIGLSQRRPPSVLWSAESVDRRRSRPRRFGRGAANTWTMNLRQSSIPWWTNMHLSSLIESYRGVGFLCMDYLQTPRHF